MAPCPSVECARRLIGFSDSRRHKENGPEANPLKAYL
jgi:hypothetical protein